jgi:2-polyprenyl-3-methyl-5-hydroxy-6-metoxy-1,4-benzoquinol methylase
MLPDVDGLLGLDIGCGEGHNTRLLAGRDAKVIAVDISEVFIQHAQLLEHGQSLGINYQIASVQFLTLRPAS